jgi:hypothetical protein
MSFQEKVFEKSTLSVEKGALDILSVEKLKLDSKVHICAFIHLKSDYTSTVNTYLLLQGHKARTWVISQGA